MTRHADANLFGLYRLADLALADRIAKAAPNQWYGEGPGGDTNGPTYDSAEGREAAQ